MKDNVISNDFDWYYDLYRRDRKIYIVVLPPGKQLQFKFWSEYFVEVNPKEYDIDSKNDHKHGVFVCFPIDGHGVGGTKRETSLSSSPVFPRAIEVIYKLQRKFIGIRQFMKLYDLDGMYEEWEKRFKLFNSGIRFRGRNICIAGSTGLGNYFFIRLQSSFHRGENMYFLYNIDYVTRFPYRDFVYDVAAAIVKWVTDIMPPLSDYGRSHVAAFQYYWGFFENEIGVRVVDENGNPARHFYYHVYSVEDIVGVIGKERLDRVEFLGIAVIEDTAEGPRLVVKPYVVG
ncbi:MAG: hypothetical protein GXO43_06145 [Crenarchaeota archaeon]|nr:hypothetical protein [Thermoproteota archaeon]